MRRPRLTVRVRLTLLYTLVFAAFGAALVGTTYALLAASLPAVAAGTAEDRQPPPDFVDAYTRILNGQPTPDANLRTKCQKAYDEGLLHGARSQRDATLHALLWQAGLSLGAGTLLAAVAGWFVAGRVLRPIHRLTTAARSASQHNLSARVGLGGPRDELRELADTFDTMLDSQHNLSARVGLGGPRDELRELADTFDTMLERLERAFAGQRRFIASASHELRTPLTVMRASVDVVLAKEHATEAELRRMGLDVRAAVLHAESLIEALLTLARTEGGPAGREPADLATVAEDVLDGTDLRDRIVHRALDPAPTSGDPILLERLTANLVDNAVRYNVPGGELWLSTSAAGGHARLEVSNRGPLVPAEAAGALFEPFRRLHERTGGDGFGLGLAVVAAIAQAHGGAVAAQPRPGGGLRVTVLLPRAPVST